MLNVNTILGVICFIIGSIFAIQARGSLKSRTGMIGAILSTFGLVFIGLTLSGAIPVLGA